MAEVSLEARVAVITRGLELLSRMEGLFTQTIQEGLALEASGAIESEIDALLERAYSEFEAGEAELDRLDKMMALFDAIENTEADPEA